MRSQTRITLLFKYNGQLLRFAYIMHGKQDFLFSKPAKNKGAISEEKNDFQNDQVKILLLL